MRIIFILVIIFVVFGCEKQPKAHFIPFPEILDSTDINPEINFDYYEFRVGPNSTKVYLSTSKSQLKSDEVIAIRNKFDTIQVNSGFSEFPHMNGFNYVISQYNNEVSIWNTINDLKFFLGEIDTKTEAQIYIMSLGFPPVINDTSKTAVKRDGNKYIVRATKMDSLCNPIVTNRYTFLLFPNGSIDTLKMETINRDEKGCI